jgi:GNAT superfamily N-acetyltransferase
METDVVHIRPARPKDASALADVYAEAWRGAYRGIIPHLSLERMIARRGERWWKSALAERRPLLVLDFDGAASGYVTYGRCRSGRTPFQGEIFELYLHPVYQGLGLGEKLFERARQRLSDLRLRGLMVWALTDNDGACAFYLSLGGKPVAEGAERFGDVSLRKVAFAWSCWPSEGSKSFTPRAIRRRCSPKGAAKPAVRSIRSWRPRISPGSPRCFF